MTFYDAVTVGERGQIVIPQAAREYFGIKPGSKLLVVGGGGPGALVLLKAEMVTVMLKGLIGLEKLLGGEENPAETQAP
jgi:AbrB family looped-hinge helix DNA binding protein